MRKEMKRTSRHALIVTALFVCCAATMAKADALVITTEEYPPFNMSAGDEVTGLATDIVKTALAKAKTPFGITLYPWLRAYDMALKDRNTCVYSTTRTEKRETLFKWIGPLLHNEWVIFARADSTIKLTSIDDLKPYSVGGYQGDALTDFLKEQGGIPSRHRIAVAALPAKDASVANIVWLPRLIPKAEAKLRGEMPPELMYDCGGDRKFFKTHGLDPADFLRKVWDAQGNHAQVIDWVKANSKA